MKVGASSAATAKAEKEAERKKQFFPIADKSSNNALSHVAELCGRVVVDDMLENE